MSSRVFVCAACGADVKVGKNGQWSSKDHYACPMAGKDAASPEHKACPQHAQLVWVLGPYSTFRGCPVAGCVAGKPDKFGNRKPWRHFTRNGTATPDDSTPDTEPTPEPTMSAPVAIHAAFEAATLKPSKMAPTHQSNALSNLGTLGDMIKDYVEVRAAEIAAEIAANAVSSMDARGPIAISWTVNAKPFAEISGAHHKALPRLLKLYAAGFRNFLVVGPAGSGKTTLASNLATALSTAFAHVSCTAGMSESALTGRAIPNLSTGETAYQGTEYVRLYEAGGVFLLDETDAADANVMLTVNSGLANGHMALPNRTEVPQATRHTDSVIICAANTWGTGADRQYVGRNQLDAAFLDRFVGATVEVDYDRDLEAALAGDAHICARVWEIRAAVASLKLRRVVGTRFLLSCVRLVKGAGETLDAALGACMTGWTTDERVKVGVRS